MRPRALITGPSSGLGLVYAHNLAADHYHPVLAARREDRPPTHADPPEADPPTRATAVVSALSHPSSLDHSVPLHDATRIRVSTHRPR